MGEAAEATTAGSSLDTQVFMTARDWGAIARRLGLSPQQMRIAQLVVEQDLPASGIALALGISTGSVTKQIERMYRKLPGVRSRAALVNRVWVEYWRMREESAAADGLAVAGPIQPRSTAHSASLPPPLEQPST